MAHAQAGLALQLMADAEALHQQQQRLQLANAPADPPLDSVVTTVDDALRAKETRQQIQDLLRRAVQLTKDAMQLYQKLGGDNSADVATMVR